MSSILRLAAASSARAVKSSSPIMTRSAAFHRHAIQTSRATPLTVSRLASVPSKKVVVPTINVIQQRASYHDDGAYGYRVPSVYSMPDYTAEELANRVENANLLRLVIGYRTHGHRRADLDPLNIVQAENVLALSPERYALTDPSKVYNLSGILHVNQSKSSAQAKEEATLEAVVSHLEKSYCGKIAYEFTHIPNASERRWFAHQVESYQKPPITPEDKQRIFELLTKSEVFDHFMGKKFAQVKRYGLEGAESMMVALDALFHTASKAGVTEAVLGMPHRGRLNLLTDLMQYDPTALFSKVKGNPEFPAGLPASGDVLSHIANSPKLDYGEAEPLHVSMLHNPSHLEAVNPVAMGKARAKQMDLIAASSPECQLGDKVMCVQLHGDAAFTGQGVVMESLGLSNLPHFTSGGSIHIVVNNQIGYTTPAQNARSSVYSSDIGKMINAPVIHVNGDHPEEVVHAMRIAFEYRNKFRKDVILDLIAYRRWGHNELDEPAFTQPLMYNNIRARKSVPKLYEEKLMAEDILTKASIDEFRQDYFEKLEDDFSEIDSFKPEADHLQGKWKDMILPTETVSRIDTGIDKEQMHEIGQASVTAPEDFEIHPRLEKFHVQSRLNKLKDGQKIDWATAEAIAFGSLLKEGFDVRICGQDVGRGTFSQRHAMLVDQKTERVHVPLNAMSQSQGHLEVANSSLSELAVLAFETGMSYETPKMLNIWEAQFGDFFNSAQVTIDTYVSSAETKWLRQSGLVMLLPHGYDGAGPEHSTCRIERWLQMTNDAFDVTDSSIKANTNMHVVNPTTPAQYFHLLRRQMKRNFRKPLIVIGPKTLLRLPTAVSTLEDMAPGTTFEPVLGDVQTEKNPGAVEKVLFVSGKLYYDLIKERQAKGADDKVAIVRVEELSPFPKDGLKQQIETYSGAKDFTWIQEEPQNGGAYSFMEPRIRQMLPESKSLNYIGREASAAPATGIAVVHRKESADILAKAFRL
ncbi:probable 2-oxoglutarate dehydrogenase E1 component DHKTD1 [Entomortierella parvispora]|uniref:Probable 2-oxoglutarate dehydrogenase E1 component DHKTD1 n=1 Tax=Entomortierella parvispora TaxID=205924 RepID=A0A9P3HID1_9FUNG|nr:probable 2-oxoglutarate dehydrogenase E1 component DHKTD1 [Entomortierella parvispora]